MNLKKWADYLISEVSYDKNHLILRAKRHEEKENGISKGELVGRIKISSDISNGLSYITIYDHISSWKKGNPISFFRLGGEPYLRIDKNKVNQDYLGDLPRLEISSEPKQPTPESEEATPEQLARLEELEKQIAKFESLPTQEPPKSPRGSLPRDTSEELPQELELAPEPIIESPPEPEEATPEQLARLEELEKQIEKFESLPTQEPEEDISEQLAQLEKLEKQIAKLESKIEEPEEEPEEDISEQLAQLEKLEKQIAKLESKAKKIKTKKPKTKKIKTTKSKTTKTKKQKESEEATLEQLARLEELEKQIAKLESKK